MSPARMHDRLDVLASEIRTLRRSLIEDERRSLELIGDEREIQKRSEVATTTRALLTAALVEHFEIAHHLFSASCPIHGSAATFLGCPTCARAARARVHTPLAERAIRS